MTDTASEATLDKAASAAATQRVHSLDVLRGLTILTMVFVNDVGPAAPSWAHHIQPPDADGMTLADIVFPTFLFIVGVSIPLAIHRARQQGASKLELIGHVLSRTLALLLMGLVEFNKADDVVLGEYWWGLLGYISILFAWCVIPTQPGTRRRVFQIIKGLGVVGLAALLFVFRREPTTATVAFYGEVQDWTWLQTGWWGILGLIGWAYLVASLVYLCLGHRREWLMGAAAILTCFFLADRSGGFFLHVETKPWLGYTYVAIEAFRGIVEGVDKFIDIGGILGSQAAISVVGCLLGSILLPTSNLQSHRERISWTLQFSAGLFVAGLALDFFAGINKIGATPTWCLWSCAIAALVWVIAYTLIDAYGWKRSWFALVGPAGANPLIAYLLHPIIIWCLALAGLSNIVQSYASSESAWIAVFGSLAMSVSVCLLTAGIARTGFRVRI